MKMGMSSMFLVVPFLIANSFWQIRFSQASSHESRLLQNLLKSYQKYERPVAIESEPVELIFGISLQQIIDLDERNQLLKSNLWLEYSWYDVNLRWNSVSNI